MGVHSKFSSIEERFLSFVKTDEKGCMLWRGGLNHHGYGIFALWDFNGKSKTVLAHRWAYEFRNGRIPDGLVIDHLCRVRNCVNPLHMEPVTIQENTLRGSLAKTHCIHGHLYDEITTLRHRKTGNRYCRECLKTRGKPKSP